MVQVGVYLPSKCGALRSTLSTTTHTQKKTDTYIVKVYCITSGYTHIRV
jgi:hypothetical protein